jgi:MFS family permease
MEQGAPSDRADRDFLLELFRGMRGEIELRIAIQNWLLAGTLVSSMSGWIAMSAVPRLAAWIATCLIVGIGLASLMWTHSRARTMQIRAYLIEVLEPRLLIDRSLGWEVWHKRRRFSDLLGSRWFVSTIGLFVGCQVLSLAAAFVVGDVRDSKPLLIASALAIAGTALLLRRPRLPEATGPERP